mgnify:CR=1 FL=1
MVYYKQTEVRNFCDTNRLAMPKQQHFLGIKIDDVTYDEALLQTAAFLRSTSLHQIVTVGPEFLLESRGNARFADVLNHADLSVPDGIGLLIIGRLIGKKLRQRITGIDLTMVLARQADEQGKSLFLLGGNPGVAESAACALHARFPTLHIAGTATFPMFSRDAWNNLSENKDIIAESERMLETIAKTQPDILLVAFGAPQQDIWIDAFRQRMPSVHIAMGVGGTFDVLAGNLRRAPATFQKLGIEWLWRLFLQPKRIWRILRATIVFPVTLFIEQSKNQKT